MVERIAALSPVAAVGRSAAAQSGRLPVAGEELRLILATRQTDGTLELQGAGVTWLLPGWPLPGEVPAPGSELRLLVRAVTPRLELVWLDAPGVAATPEEGAAAPAWQRDQASWPRLTLERPDAAKLGGDWREALLGKLAVSAARFRQEGGSHLSGALLLAAPQLALAGLRGQTLAEAPLPLTLPLWLWGGPALALSVEDAMPGQDEASDDDTLDLLLEATLPEVGWMRLRLRLQPAGVVLVLVASAAGCRWLAAWREPIRQAVERTGLHLVACHIGERDVLPGLALGRHGVSLLEARRVSLALFAVAAEVMLLLCPPPESVPGGASAGLV
ncbi:hypothetical protein NH8B_2912 [Pseudogulbenkiania sp. NH8B]|uniref:hypothetical protein n=1 Tax=Pseudogulbenkiania sp. (strain NH8B) TaxID=748280 RepID=UPI0002279DA7|nr:hypothetical protein [Pseudogulbenkiania sp. NH8B]BAK77704.1 hypothetical protein NH8B_2912 [Pseudogulbenkiania sp. NH8B]